MKFFRLSSTCFIIAGLINLSLASAGLSDIDYTFSCYGSDDIKEDFCDMLTWNAARAYPTVNYTVYQPGTPLSWEQQDLLAEERYRKMTTGSTSPMCKNAVKRFVCAETFPECATSPTSTSGIAYFPTCKTQCQQVDQFCATHLKCNNYTTTTCMMILPPGYFLLNQEQGPFDDLPVIYGVALGVWIVYAFLWNFTTFITYKDSTVLLSRALSSLPIIKVVVVTLAVCFWSTCDTWLMCSFWLGVSLINTHLVFETSLLVSFLLVAKGWSITRDNFTANEWRGIIMSMSAFYMTNSILLVLQNSVLTQVGFWIASAVLYGSMYLYILQSCFVQLRVIRSQVMMLPATTPPAISRPLQYKYFMYCSFVVLITLNIIAEIFIHSLVGSDGRMWVILLVYEVSDLIILGTIGFIFRPTEYSPFFFMVPARLNDARTRSIPLVEGTYSSADPSDIELASLLSDDTHTWPSKMILLQQPNRDIRVAVTPIIVPARTRTAATTSTTPTTTSAANRQTRTFDSDVMF